MPDQKDSSSGRAQNGEFGILRSLILIAIPWLSLQRDLLQTVRKGLEEQQKEDIYIKPIQHLVHEIHALLMVFDRSRMLRDRLGEDLEQKLVDELTQIVKKLAAGSADFIEAQEIILGRMSDILAVVKDGGQRKSRAAER